LPHRPLLERGNAKAFPRFEADPNVVRVLAPPRSAIAAVRKRRARRIGCGKSQISRDAVRGTGRAEVCAEAMRFHEDRDSFDRYRSSLAGTLTLSPEREKELARRWAEGDAAAGNQLIQASLPFVIAIALEYRRWGAPIADLVQQGNLGLLKGARKFDPSRECRLITYAVYWIRAEIRDYVVRAYRLVRIGTTKGERRAMRAYRKTREEDPAALARESGLPIEQIERLLPMLRARDVSLDASYDDQVSVLDRLADGGALQDEALQREHHRARARHDVAEALERLPEREAMIVRERLLVDEPVTLEALGVRLGISKERVRQLEERARKRLREDLAGLQGVAA
jgi:RNA polymerase sigma-32 factor